MGFDVGVMADAIVYIKQEWDLSFFQEELCLGILNIVAVSGGPTCAIMHAQYLAPLPCTLACHPGVRNSSGARNRRCMGEETNRGPIVLLNVCRAAGDGRIHVLCMAHAWTCHRRRRNRRVLCRCACIYKRTLASRSARVHGRIGERFNPHILPLRRASVRGSNSISLLPVLFILNCLTVRSFHQFWHSSWVPGWVPLRVQHHQPLSLARHVLLGRCRARVCAACPLVYPRVATVARVSRIARRGH